MRLPCDAFRGQQPWEATIGWGLLSSNASSTKSMRRLWFLIPYDFVAAESIVCPSYATSLQGETGHSEAQQMRQERRAIMPGSFERAACTPQTTCTPFPTRTHEQCCPPGRSCKHHASCKSCHEQSDIFIDALSAGLEPALDIKQHMPSGLLDNYQQYWKASGGTSGAEKPVLWDLFCGIGTIGLSLAAQCSRVIGIDGAGALFILSPSENLLRSASL